MNDIFPSWMKTIFSGLGAVFGYLFGGWTGLLEALVVLIVIDCITGVIVAVHEKRLSSKICITGAFKKAMMMFIVCVAHMLDVHVLSDALGGTVGAPLMTMCEFLFIANEGISILENAGAMGVLLPARLIAALKQLQKDSGGEGSTDSADSDDSDGDSSDIADSGGGTDIDDSAGDSK